VILNVGVTGHRSGVLTPPLVRTLRPLVYTVFRQLRAAALELQRSEDCFCSSTEARLRLHTALATGADQLAASCARSSGYVVRALLPFEAALYREDFALGEELDGFEQGLAAVDEVIALPGTRADPQGAYVLVGEQLVTVADMMIAIWDGEQGHGPGGTAHVVELALRSSLPVIHIDIDRRSDEVRMRALVGEAASQLPGGRREVDLYTDVLRAAFKLKPANGHAPQVGGT
jgi:hypothetical protein